MKVFGIYEKIDGVDMIDTFNAFYECVSIYAAVKLFIKNAKTEYGIYDHLLLIKNHEFVN